ncbi:MAG TPA: response regulator transcription factor [Candidatus Obscuribacter sp.]|jgi:DNA-binding response OmpR family regulator|nr:response regulator transcription factor [Candidatus Melainabacteria bacterium]MBK8224626.1 response regulator transcription factor [Candidatus Obscuribacter sp.]MBK9277726.1 response regulator transcription factor [Candidatus Obscuribacter sp.]MBL8083928.1 response regulator transcription factor [Candidatus Obscuribacter sp.]MDX1989412.1 response regulator transcription factor [Candidatus Obscuribacter sp.]
MAKILIAEDDRLVAGMLKDLLELDQHTVELAHNGRDALDLVCSFPYDLLILDLGLPEMEGTEVLNRYRGRGGKLPVLILSGRNDVNHKIEGLDLGADDYMTKPYDVRELNARIRSLLRRQFVADVVSNVLKVGHLEMDTARCEVLKSGEKLKLLPTEYALLEFFMRNRGRVFSASELLERIWKSDSDASENAVRTYITRLRKKIDEEGKASLITSVYGLGYKMEEVDNR